MSAHPHETSAKTFTGWHMLVVVCSFFAVVIAVNITMAVFATESWTGLVVKNSYVASQEFNGHQAEARAQAARGWTSTLSHDDRHLMFSLKTREGTPLAGARPSVKLTRPVGTHQDHTLTFSEVSPGVYQSDEILAPGVWNADVTALMADGQTYRQIFRLHVRETR